MARPALDPAYVAARLATAKQQAQRINRKLPPNVYAWATPHGRIYIRYEPPAGRKVILRAPYPSIDFDVELLAARRGLVPPPPPRPKTQRRDAPDVAHTWRWLCEAYYEGSTYKSYSQRDQRVRRGVLQRTIDAPLLPDRPDGLIFGDMPVQQFSTKAIITLRDRFSHRAVVPDAMYPDDTSKAREIPTTPEAANSVVKYIRGVIDWAVEQHTNLVSQNWAKQVKYLPRGRGHKTWGPEQCSIFEAHHPQGTMPRLIYDLAKYTGQRLSDIARLGDGMLRTTTDGRTHYVVPQAKGRNNSPAIGIVPVFAEISVALDAARSAGILGHTTYIAQSNGKPYTSESVANLFRDACAEAGLVGYPLHGLRKTAVVNLISAGCSTQEIMSITGHRSAKEVERYGRDYDRARAAQRVADKWDAHRSAGRTNPPA